MNFIRNDSIEPVDSRESVRAFFCTREQLPPLEKGDRGWVYFFDKWRECRVKGRIPGGCYRATLTPPVDGCHQVVVCSNNYGGLVE